MFSNIDEKDDVNSENRKTKSNIKKKQNGWNRLLRGRSEREQAICAHLNGLFQSS